MVRFLIGVLIGVLIGAIMASKIPSIGLNSTSKVIENGVLEVSKTVIQEEIEKQNKWLGSTKKELDRREKEILTKMKLFLEEIE